MSREHPTPNSNNSGTILALLGLLSIVGGLLFLLAVILPMVRGLLIVVSGFTFFIAFHYFLWGRWLTQRVADAEAEKSNPPPAEY